MKREAWEALKALQRAGRRDAPHGQASYIDRRRQQTGMRPLFGAPKMSRKAARRAREKARNG